MKTLGFGFLRQGLGALALALSLGAAAQGTAAPMSATASASSASPSPQKVLRLSFPTAETGFDPAEVGVEFG